MQPLDGAQQAQAAEQAKLANPEAVAERERSRTQFEGLDVASAVSLAEGKFGIQMPRWTPPGSQEGAHITKYVGERSAAETSASGQHLLLESSMPLRSAVGSGQLAPVSLTLEDQGASWGPANPLVPVSISKSPSGGVALPLGVGIAPAQAGSPQAAELVGNRVVYPGTATDTDFMVEPLPAGVEMSWQLLSQASSQDNSLVFTLPEGASLRLSNSVRGGAEVVKEGQTLSKIPPASATEANGVSLPISYTVSGDTLTTHVNLSGSVAFPVLVDPLVTGYYGEANGESYWPNWYSASNCSCIVAEGGPSQLNVIVNPGTPINDYGEWYIYAPGAGSTGGAGIARVDITGVNHAGPYESALQADIGLSNGGNPVWTFNGLAGAQGASPYNSDQELQGYPMAFCAQGAGGHDGGEQPLCDMNYSGQYFQYATVAGPESVINENYSQVEGATVTYLDSTPPIEANITNISNSWLKAGPTNSALNGYDQGVGVQALTVEIPPGHTSEGHPFFAEEYSCPANGFVGCPAGAISKAIPHLNELATGAYTLGVYAYDAAGNVREEQPDPKLYIDHTAPSVPALSGSLKEANGGVIGSGNYVLKFSAEDGSTSAPQSGVRYLQVWVNGVGPVAEVTTSCPFPTGVPSPECFGLSGSWTMEGHNYGAGSHTVIVKAYDWLGNESVSEPIHVTVNEAPYQSLGPGAVNLKTGDYKLTAGDVAITAAGADLSITRSNDSRGPSHGAGGLLGPQWELGMPDLAGGGVWKSLLVTPDGSVNAAAANGNSVLFASNGSGGYTAPAGYQTVTLSEPSKSPVEYRLTDASGNATIFSHAGTGEESSPFYVASGVVQATGAGGLNKVTYVYTKNAEGTIEPTRVVGPYPTGAKCLTEIVSGCRVLTFNYAESTTATGENENQWGDYKGHLTRVYFTTWNPVSKKPTETITVAQYSYDKLGRLRAEWNPQVSPALKTLYGYDPEGHVTALTPPGQQPWVATYGTTASDSNAGRLLKVMRPAATTGKWAGVPPADTELPKLSGSPVVGVRMSVSEGKWSGAPVAYGYQWERCTSGTCVVIPGATNQSYTLVTGDVGHTLVAQVGASNGGGTVVAASVASSLITATENPSFTEYSVASKSFPQGIAPGPDGNLWVAQWESTKISKITPSGGITEYTLPSSFECPGYITTGPAKENALWFTDGCANEIGKITTSGTTTAYKVPLGSEPQGITVGPDGNLWFANYGTSKIVKMTTSGSVVEYKLPSGSRPEEIVTGPDGNLWFTEFVGNKVGKITIAGAITEYALPANSAPTSIAAGPGKENALWFVDQETSKIGKISTTGAITEYSLPAKSAPKWIAAGPEGNLWFTDNATSKVGKITTSGTITEYSLPAGSEPLGITAGPASEKEMWFTEPGTSKVGKFKSVPTEGQLGSPQPGSTIEYNVPVSGTGLPNLSKAEAEKWGQKEDVPAEATAIFPPDEVQSWPATDYKRASIFYLDSAERTVNTSSPADGISTTEYDNHNNVKRALTADNRAAALKEGTKSGEASGKLDTQSTYNAEGTELERTLAPEHEIKLQGATEPVKARKQVKYSYDEGAPTEGSPHRLVTQTVQTAKLANGEEKEPRTVKNSYSAQENLGWKLHTPTSITTNPGGLNLTHSASYSASSGMVTETKMPGGPAEHTPTYSSQFGSKGANGGQFTNPREVATDASGDAWITDAANNRLEEFSSAGVFLKTFGFGVSNGENTYQTCTTSCRAGLAGSGNGQFSEPIGITISQSTGNVYVVDRGNGRVEELSSTGAFVRAFGSLGSGSAQLSGASGIALGSSENVWVADSTNNRIEEFSSTGTFLNVVGFGVSNGEEKLETCTSGCRGGTAGAGNGQFSLPHGITPFSGNLYVTDYNNNRVEELKENGEYLLKFGSSGSGSGQFTGPFSITVEASSGTLYVTDLTNARIEAFTSAGTFLAQAGSAGTGNGQFVEPRGLVASPGGTLDVVDSGNNRVETWSLPATATGNEGARASQIVYYTPGTEASVMICQNHPEWANLPCQTQPVHQPEVSGMPELPVTTHTYNIWDEPETTKSTSGASTRTETDGYDGAGRLVSKEIASSTGTALPKITYGYSPETGSLIKQSTGTGSEEKKITSEYNKLGQMTAYTDADGKTATFEYENEKDARLTKVTDEKGYQTDAYDEITGELTSSKDSTAGTFTAKYDPEGNLTSERLPNGMTATTTLNPVHETTGLKYVKETHCTEQCEWFFDNVVPSIHGQWITQTSTLATNNYAYDESGRLTQAQDTPAGKGCATRIYRYDADGNRTNLTRRAPGTGGSCATEGGEEEKHNYDTADQLIDTGTAYNPFGDITTLPATDAGGKEPSENLTSSYYSDGQLASQEQTGQAIGYQLDPARRTRETISTGKKTSDVLNHYDGPGTTPSWMSYTSGEWTRDISGIAGGLSAVQYNTETPVLQIGNLHGDIIATVADNETATKLSSTQNTTEYGVPTTPEPPKYSWLGAGEFPTELASGVIAMGARSYIPQLGRFLQPDPQPGGSASAYAYTNGNPLNESDPSGGWSLNETSGGLSAVGTGEGTQLASGVGIAAGAIMPPPVNTQIEAAFAANPPWDQLTAGTEEYEEYEEEYEEEEGEYEYVANHHGAERGKEEGHMEGGVLYQPLGEEAGGEVTTHLGATIPLCEAVAERPCARLVPCAHCKGAPESQCNKTGQHCGGRRGGVRESGKRRVGNHRAKPSCPKGYILMDLGIVKFCAGIDLPGSGPTPVPSAPPGPFPVPVPVP